MHVHSHHGGHSHAHHHGLGESSTVILGASVLATLTLVVVEFGAGYAGHSISLISDGFHNLTDVPDADNLLAGHARWALRPPTPEKTYGYHRAGILGLLL